MKEQNENEGKRRIKKRGKKRRIDKYIQCKIQENTHKIKEILLVRVKKTSMMA